MLHASGAIGSPAWWFSAVVVAIAVHLAASYLKPRIDGMLLRGSSWWRSKSTKRIAQRDARIAELVNDERLLAGVRAEVIIALLTAILFAIMSLFSVALSLFEMAVGVVPSSIRVYVVGVMASIGIGCIVVSLACVSESVDYGAVMRAAEAKHKRRTSNQTAVETSPGPTSPH